MPFLPLILGDLVGNSQTRSRSISTRQLQKVINQALATVILRNGMQHLAQVDADIRGVIDPVAAEAILTQPEWNRRRLLFLNLAAPFLEEDEEGMEQEEVRLPYELHSPHLPHPT